MGKKIIHEKIIFIFKHFASLFIALRVLYIFIRFYFINTFFLFCIFQREEFRICLLFKCAAREEIWEKKTKHVISYFVNKKNKKGRNVDSLFNMWMFHTNVIRRIHDMYKKKAEKKKESHLPTNLFFSSIPDNMNSSAVSFHICPRHMRIEIIDKREYNNLYTVIFFFLPFFLV